ncbi:MAG: hypothetical protein ACC707_00170 [Thiohalomonadales bacterium]
MKKIFLTTPIQDKHQNPAVELNPSNLECTLRGLRSSDMVETVRRLDEALTAFNELRIPAADRLKLLEIYHNAFQKLLQGFDEMRIAQLKVPAQQKQQLSNNIMWLHIKLSHGYKIIVKDYLGSRVKTDQPTYLLLAVFRAMEQTMVSLIYSYRFGFDTPPLTYLDLHQLYAFTEYHALLNKPVKAASGYAKTPTIASYYTLALFFTSIDPRQYESYTLEVLFLALQPFSFKCSVSRSLQSNRASYIYKINLNENKAPTIVGAKQNNEKRKSTRYLIMDNFIAEISGWLEDNKENKNTLLIEQELELFPTLLTRLNHNFSNNNFIKNNPALAEIDSEFKSKDQVTLIIGLESIDNLLRMQLIDLNFRLNCHLSSWTVLAESSSGCELASHVDKVTEEFSLGELIATVSSDNNDQSIELITIAHIRSLQQLESGQVVLELEYLPGCAHPFTYLQMSVEGEINNAVSTTGIYLEDEVDNGNGPMMILNRRHYQPSQRYMIKAAEKVCTLEATKLVRQSPKYSYFHYSILQEQRTENVGANSTIKIAV